MKALPPGQRFCYCDAAGDAIGKTADTFANDPGMHEGLKTAGKYAAMAAGGTALGVAGMAGGAAAATGVLGTGAEMLGSGLAAYGAEAASAASNAVQKGVETVVGNPGKVAVVTENVLDAMNKTTPTTPLGYIKYIVEEGYGQINDYFKRQK